MNQIHCHIIQDLLPLYIDRVCSKETLCLVEEHLRSCSACQTVYREMCGQIPAAPQDLDSKLAFRKLCSTVIWIVLAAAMMIICLSANIGGAWMGDPAGFENLLITIVYCLFWGVFTVLSRKSAALSKTAFLISLLTFISSANSLVWRLLGHGGFITAFLSIFASVPFYGLRFFMGWSALYAAAAILSLIWLIFTGVLLRRNKAHIP